MKWIALLLLAASAAWAEGKSGLAQQIAEVMSQSPSGKAGQRFVHAKGIVCEGMFEPSAEAAGISRAAHFQGGSTPVTVRFSIGAGNAEAADTSPDAAPQGMAIRFLTGRGTDIVAMSHNGFVVGTGEEFLALQVAIFGTDPAKPHPWPIEEFLGSHPRALKFVQDNKAQPASFAMEGFFANNAFRFTNREGKVRAGRYQILPVAGTSFLSEKEGKSKSADYLRADLKARLEYGPVQYRLVLQLANEGDRTNDSSEIWPNDRQKVELGVISIRAIVPDSVAAERALAFDPIRLTDGIALGDDPLPALRSAVYAISAAARRKSAR